MTDSTQGAAQAENEPQAPLKERLRRLRNSPWVIVTTISAAIVTLLLFLAAVLERVVSNTLLSAIFIAVYILFTALALVFNFVIIRSLITKLETQQIRHHQEVSRNQAAVHLLASFPHFGEVCKHFRRFAQTMTDAVTEKEALNQLRISLHGLAEIFSTLTGSSCRLCIKSVQGRQGDDALEYVRTFVRDSGDETDPVPHPVAENTDFKAILWGNESYWLHNDLQELARDGRYVNTSPNWISTYRSTIVWPIRSAFPEGIVGFLCLDSTATNVFVKERDVYLGFAFVDLLSATLERARSLGIVALQETAVSVEGE